MHKRVRQKLQALMKVMQMKWNRTTYDANEISDEFEAIKRGVIGYCAM